MPTSNITPVIRKIFDDYDEKNGANKRLTTHKKMNKETLTNDTQAL